VISELARPFSRLVPAATLVWHQFAARRHLAVPALVLASLAGFPLKALQVFGSVLEDPKSGQMRDLKSNRSLPWKR
jgi:hypothetical protein